MLRECIINTPSWKVFSCNCRYTRTNIIAINGRSCNLLQLPCRRNIENQTIFDIFAGTLQFYNCCWWNDNIYRHPVEFYYHRLCVSSKWSYQTHVKCKIQWNIVGKKPKVMQLCNIWCYYKTMGWCELGKWSNRSWEEQEEKKKNYMHHNRIWRVKEKIITIRSETVTQ